MLVGGVMVSPVEPCAQRPLRTAKQAEWPARVLRQAQDDTLVRMTAPQDDTLVRMTRSAMISFTCFLTASK
jgi:hypothetical protein